MERGGNRKQRRADKNQVRENKVNEGQRQIKDKFLEQRKIKPLQAKNPRQQKALAMMQHKQLMCLVGASGSGKTELACWYASKLWLEGVVDNIIITRPNKSMDGDNAPIPGNDFQKVLPYTMSMLMKLKKYLGAGILKNNLRQEMADMLFNDVSGIQVYSMEKLNGLSFDERTIIIADEVQSATVGQVKSLLTRCEKGCRMFICGDPLQTAIGSGNGLEYLLDMMDRHDHPDIGVVQFLPQDCCREGISAFFTEIFEEEGAWSK